MSRPPFRADHVGSFLRPERLLASAREILRRRTSRGRIARNRGRVHPRGRARAGECGPEGDNRRRISPHLFPRRFSRTARRRRDALRGVRRAFPEGRRHEGRFHAADHACRQQGQMGRSDSGAGFRFPQRRRPARRKSAFRRRRCCISAAAARRSASGLSAPGGFLRRSDRRLSRRGRRSRGARLPLPAVRRHQSGLSLRSRHSRPHQGARRRSGRARRGSIASSSTIRSATGRRT